MTTPNPPAAKSVALTVNGGSSSIKFAAYAAGDPPQRLLAGQIERIGQPDASLSARLADGGSEQLPLAAADHRQAASQLIGWLAKKIRREAIVGVGHRVVHGGIHLVDHQRVTDALVAELKSAQPLDLAHLPREIALIEAFRDEFGAPQVACFDTAFHRDLPRMAQLLPIPRKYDQAGLRRFGFHGLSYAYLMTELRRVAGDAAADGKVILAHLGSGASMAAVSGGKPFETTMAFTPLAGLVMGTRPGDLDPGLLVYLMRVEKLSAEQLDDLLSHDCGLKGVSETSSDMRDLWSGRVGDGRAAEAIDLFCYRARQWIGALAATMGGLETLVFSAGIGEHDAAARAQICQGLQFLGVQVDPARNGQSPPPAVISPDGSPVTVRVIATDEELMIARATFRLIG